MSEWKEAKLGNFIIYKKGFAFKSKDLGKSGHRVIKVKDFTDNSINILQCQFLDISLAKNYDDYKLKEGDVIISTVGSWPSNPASIVGKVVKVPKIAENSLLNQNAVRLRSNEKILQSYLYYMLKTQAFLDYLISVAQGSANQASITLNDIFNYMFKLPLLKEQKAIAEVLSSLDDKIDLLHRQNKTLEELAQTFFRQWFIEEAKDEWEVGTLEDIMEFNPTHSLKKGEMYPFLEMGNVQTFKSSVADWYERAFTSGTKFKNGDTLLARITPSLENGKTAYVDFLQNNEIGWGSTEFIVMRMKEDYHPFISYLIARNEDFREFAIGNMTGSTGRQRAQAKDIKKYEISIPPIEIIKKLNESIEYIPIKIKANSKQIKTLENIRDTLLPKLMSGEVKFKL